MYTSILLVAMLGPGAASDRSTPESLSWQESYTGARRVGRQQGKPLAVFIGAGRDGFKQVCKGQALPAEARDVLAANYVCVYLDTLTAPGRRLAEAFEIADGPGLVLSTPNGKDQAFRHSGTLTAARLESRLRKHAGRDASAGDQMKDGQVPVSYSYAPVYRSVPTVAYPASIYGTPQYISPSYTPTYLAANYAAPSTSYAGGYYAHASQSTFGGGYSSYGASSAGYSAPGRVMSAGSRSC
jgi:hypothetical protein